MQKVAIKYCGGCNPDYDRVDLVKRIKQSLNGKVEFVSLEDKNIDLVPAIEGCQTACADLSGINPSKISIICNVHDPHNILNELHQKIKRT
jgi:hypothetical protein